jgi:hypothetical protein
LARLSQRLKATDWEGIERKVRNTLEQLLGFLFRRGGRVQLSHAILKLRHRISRGKSGFQKTNILNFTKQARHLCHMTYQLSVACNYALYALDMAVE